MSATANAMKMNGAGLDPKIGDILHLLQSNPAAMDTVRTLALQYLSEEEQEGLLRLIDVFGSQLRSNLPTVVDGELSEEPIADESQSEIGILRRNNQTLAAALGACPDCWDIDPENCKTCHNDDAPIEPDDMLFADFVFPTIPHLKPRTRYQLVRLLSEIRKQEREDEDSED